MRKQKEKEDDGTRDDDGKAGLFLGCSSTRRPSRGAGRSRAANTRKRPYSGDGSLFWVVVVVVVGLYAGHYGKRQGGGSEASQPEK